jgi:hypothetical protein
MLPFGTCLPLLPWGEGWREHATIDTQLIEKSGTCAAGGLKPQI